MNAEYEQIHEAVRLDPVSVWERLSAFLCTSATGSSAGEEHLERVDLIEDLMFWHADAFIDRLQALAETCPDLQEDVAAAYVGGLAGSPGLDQFYELQETFASRLESEGRLARWKGWMPLEPPTPG